MKLPPWAVTAFPIVWSGKRNDDDAPDPCSVRLSQSTIGNGKAAVLTVRATKGTRAGAWCAIRMDSATPDPAGSHNDSRHQWLTGVHFVA